MICPICERDLDIHPHTTWEAQDCTEESQLLRKLGLPPNASFLNPRNVARLAREERDGHPWRRVPLHEEAIDDSVYGVSLNEEGRCPECEGGK